CAGVALSACGPPTRTARNSTTLTAQAKLTIKRAEFARDPRPLDETCDSYSCRNFSRASFRHLCGAGPALSSQRKRWHTLYFSHRLMERWREAIRRERTDFWSREAAVFLQPV